MSVYTKIRRGRNAESEESSGELLGTFADTFLVYSQQLLRAIPQLRFLLFILAVCLGSFRVSAQNPLWGIKDYTNLGYFSNTNTYPWTWTTLATLSGGNYNATASIKGGMGIIFNQNTRIFHFVNTTTGALTALTTTNAGSVPRSLNYNVAAYDPITSRFYLANENDRYGHIYSVNIAGNSVTYISEKDFGQALNSDDWTFINGKLIGQDYSTIEIWDIATNTYTEQAVSGASVGEVQGSWANTDGTIGFYGESNQIFKYNIATNTTSLVGTSSTSFSNGGEPHDLANLYFGVTVSPLKGGIGTPFSGSVAGVGGTSPYTYVLTSGTLPPGLAFNAATGAITGTPTTIGSYPLSFQATDSNTPTALTTMTSVVMVIGKDSDGDGVFDDEDLDDDNDGIPDKVENLCPTYATWTDWTALTAYSSATGTLPLSAGTVTVTYTSAQVISIQGISGSYFNLGDAYAGLMPASGTEGLQAHHGAGTTHTYTFSQPVKDPILVFWSMNSNSFTFTQPFIILGQQGGVTQSGNTVVGAAGECNTTIQLLGTFTSISYSSSILEGWTGVTVGVQQCQYGLDSDGDTVANTFDLDSDGDGCSDAYEGGATSDKTANFKFTSAAGTNGLVDVLEMVADNGVVNYGSSYNTFALNNASIKCTLPTPGGVGAGLSLWLRADMGTTPSTTGALTSWTDFANGNNATQLGTNNVPTVINGSASLFNFNKAIQFTATDQKVGNITSTTLGTSSFDVFTLTKEGMQGNRYFNIGRNNVNLDGANWDSPAFQADDGMAMRRVSDGALIYWSHPGGTFNTSIPSITYNKFTDVSMARGFNGATLGTAGTYSSAGAPMGGYIVGNNYGSATSGDDVGIIGTVGEYITFTRNLTAIERRRVDSYLGIKYGLTLDLTTDKTYMNSAATVVWDSTVNSNYNKNIFGIARDDEGGLNQKQSKSVNAGFQPIIGIGATIAATNAANSNSFATNMGYELIGDNGLSGTYSVAYAPASFSPPSAFYRMNRIWKVQETGTVGTVTIRVASGPDRLLVSNTAAFTPGAGTQEIALTADGSGNMTAQVDFTTGQFFSFGRVTTGPGGVVSNGTKSLAWWYKGDAGVDTSGTAVTQWKDQSLSGLDVIQATAAKQPTATSYQNFNPVVTFASNKALNNAAGYWKTSTGNAQYNVFAVAKHTYGTGTVNTLFSENTTQAEQSLFFDHGANMYMGFWGTYSAYTPFTTAVSNVPLLVSSRYNTTGNVKQFYWNGQAKTMTGFHSGTNTATFNGNNSNLVIGNHVNQSSWPFEGDIAELFMYPFDLTATQRQQVESYMAIKWGVTLDQTVAYNYLNSAGATVWDATANSGYKNNIIGIGADAAADLNQKQSKSVNAGVQPVIGLGSIAATNVANTAAFAADKSFLIAGSDAGVAKFYTAITAPAGNEANNRFTRIWKVQETGTVGTVQFAIPSYVSGGNTIYLVRSTDATFNASDIWIPLSTNVTINNMAHAAANVDFNNGDFFTLATYVGAPGCVAANLNFWLKADAIGEEDGVALAEWENQANTTLDSVGQVTVGSRPTYYETNAANLVNFNPSVSFDGGDELTQNARMFPATSAFTQIAMAVDRRTNAGEVRAPMGMGFGNGNFLGMDFQTDGVSPKGWNPYSGIDGEWGNTAANSNYQTYSLGLGATNQYGNIVGLTTNNIAGGNDNVISYVNGFKDNTTITANQNATFGNGMYVGSSGDAQWLGLVPEVLVYDKQLSDAEMQRVYSYLAIKYGVTLKQNYVNSAGTTIYDITGYANNIAGIGREVCQTLNQKQSRSMLEGVQPTIGLTTIASTNVGNSAALTDGSFMIWGSDAGATGFSTSFVFGAMNNRITRIWKVQETGTVGTVKVALRKSDFPGSATDLTLLRSTDATFNGSDTQIAMSPETIGGVDYMTATIDFANGDFYTFGAYLVAPGGVASTLEFWYRPEAGVTLNSGKVSSWIDQAKGIEVTPAAAANGPSYLTTGTDAINFHPTLNFTNTTRQDGLRANTGLSAIPTGVSTFSVLMPDDASNRWFLQWGVSGSGYYNNYGHCNANNPGVWTNSHGGCVNNPTTLGPISTPSFLSARWNNTVGTNQWQLRQNGELHSGTTTATALNVPSNTALEIGDVNNRTAGNEYVGNISEVIGYTSRLSDIDRQKVESYISIKYGITYMNDINTDARDYLNTAGTAIWNTSTNTGYNNNIAGIAKDNATALNQKQSKSVNAGIQPIIGLAIGETNAANPSVFTADMSYMVWGSDAGAATFGTTIAAPSGSTANNRMTRIWKVQETGTVGTVKFAMPNTLGNSGTVYLLRSTDATFDGTDTWIPLSNLTVGGTTYLAADIDFNNGDYFSVATYLVAPGCVAAGLDFWLDPSKSVTKTGSTVTAWRDADGSGNNPVLTQATAALQPSYSEGDAASNYNPYVNFIGNQRLNTAVTGANYSSDITTFGVVNKYTAKGSYNNFIRFTDADNSDAGTHNWGLGTSDLAEDKVSLHYISAPFVGVAPGNVYNRLNGTKLFALNTPTIMSGSLNATTGATSVGNNGNEAYATGKSGGNLVPYNFLTVGGGNSFGMNNNKTSEIIHYSRELTIQERQRVQTYLAIKYGITIDAQDNSAVIVEGDYIAGNGSTKIWDKTANTNYHNNVLGIGREDCQGLNQKQSTSINTGFQPVIGLATIAAANAANPSVFTNDGSFEMVGSDAGAASFGTAYTFGAMSHRITRIWKVQETGTVGTVKVAINSDYTASVGQLNLLVSSDATFDNSDTKLSMTLETIGGIEYYTATVDFTNGQYFTFGGFLVGPGGVAGADFWVKSDDAGAIATAWKDHSKNGNAIEAVGAWSLTAADAAHNFHPYTTGFSASKYFKDETSSLTLDNTYGVNTRTPYTIFSAVKPNGATGRIVGIDNDELFAAEPGFSIQNYKPYFYEYYEVAGSDVHTQAITSGQTSVLSFNAQQLAANSCNMRMGKDGTYENFARTGYFHNLGENLVLGYGTWDINAAFPGDIMEVAWYKRDLTTDEQDRVNSYLGIKNGVTLAINYLNSASAVVWNRSTSTGFNNNIFGIGRDDASALSQKQAKSANTVGKMTIGLVDTIAPSNAAHPAEFSNNASFIMIGDNAATGVTTFSAGNACTPPSVDKYSNLYYKITETGDVQSIKVKFDASGLGFNSSFPAFMQVASDAAFTNMIANIPAKWSGSEMVANYNFPANATTYVRFSGNTTPLANLCSGDKTIDWWWHKNRWDWGMRTKTITEGDQTFTATITDANNNILHPTWYPVSYGNSIYIPRYDNDNTGKVTFKVTMSKPSSQVSFPIYGVDAHWGIDKVVVTGGLSGGTVTPKLSKSPHSWVNIAGNQATGTQHLYAGYSHWGVTYVNFDSPVDEFTVEYTKSTTYPNWKIYNYIGIGALDITCRPIVPEVATPDNVYLFKQAIAATNKAENAFTYKFTVQNNNCGNKTISLTDNLPATLSWVDSSLVSSMAVSTINAYGNTRNLSLSNITVPPGTSYIYIQAKGTTAGTFNNQATMVLTGGGTYLSDDPSVSGSENQTPVTLTAPDPAANLAITKTVNKATTAQNTVVNYTIAITNNGASPVNTVVEDNLMGVATYVAGSLTGAPAGSQVSTYGGAANLAMRDVNIAAGATVTLTVQVNVGQTPNDSFVYNVAKVTPDPGSGYRQVSVSSNTVQTKIIAGCVAGEAVPNLAATTLSNICPKTTAHLGTIVVGNKPAGAIMTWHTATPATTANKVADSSVVSDGTYYAVFYDQTMNCYGGAVQGSATTEVTVSIDICPADINVTNVCPSNRVNLTTRFDGILPAGKVVTWHTALPTTTANKVGTPSSVGSGTYYAAFYDGANDCYSPGSPNGIIVTINLCQTSRSGNIAPALNSTSVNNVCPATTANLTTLTASNAPVGTSMTWHTGSVPDNTNVMSNITSVPAGTYYVAFYDDLANTYSPTTAVVVTIATCVTCEAGYSKPDLSATTAANTCPATKADLSTITASYSPVGATLTWHSAKPATILNKVLDPTQIATSGTYYAAFHDATNGCFSGGGDSVTAVVVTVSSCSTPDLRTYIGQPVPALVVGQQSTIPVSVKNIGGVSATGPIVTTITLPAGVSSLATFTTNGATCTTTLQTVTCTKLGAIAANDSILMDIPVTPNALIVGTNPIFNASVATVLGETNTANNTAVPMTSGSQVAAATIKVSAKVFLSGSYVTADGMMQDALRTAGLIPLPQPYASMGHTGLETVSLTVLATTGPNAIVDWVLVELRSDTSTTTIRRAALVQRDGDIVDLDGVSPVSFGAVAGNYYVVVRHRNHLGVMTATKMAISATTTVVDFTSTATANWQKGGAFGNTNAQRTFGSVRALWGGNTSGNNNIKATGAGSDGESALFKVLLDAGNAVTLSPSFILLNLYLREDANMDGRVIYQGTGTELDTVLFNVFAHPSNTGTLATYIIYEQLP